jgi:hypothetical protein
MTPQDVLPAPHAPDAPVPPLSSDGGDGFLDCRGAWHSWADEEDE